MIREGIHLAAMSNRVRDAPPEWPTFDGSGETVDDEEITEAIVRGAVRR